MKLLALRAAQFRRFTDGVAINDISPGINLLAGPNELGKSTLFEALEAAFLVPHGAGGARLEGFRPRGGGEPLVEVDFETNEGRWRIRKQFGRGKSAVLTELDTGRVVARAAEAEQQLSRLTGAGDGPGRIGLVWVRQQRGLMAPDPDLDPMSGKEKKRGEGSALKELLADEIVEAAGSGLAEEVLALAKMQFGELVNPKASSVKLKGPYDLALKAREQARSDLERAREAARASESRLARISELSQSLRNLEDPQAIAAEAERLDNLQKAITSAQGHRDQIERTTSELKSRRFEAKAAYDALERSRSADVRIAEMKAAITTAQDFDAAIKALTTAFNANAATPQRMSRLENEYALLAREELALKDMSTFVEIEPAVGGRGLIVADGVPVMDTLSVPVAERLTLEIAGIGTIRVVSSDAERAAKIARRRDACLANIATLLDEMGAASELEARAKADERRDAGARIDVLRPKLTATAPKGIQTLIQETEQLSSAQVATTQQQLEADFETANAAARSVQQALELLSAEKLAEDRFRSMMSELDAGRRAATRRQEEARRTSELLERLRGEQVGVDEDGRAGEVEKFSGLLEQAEAAVLRLEGDVAALRLLVVTLETAIEDVRTRYLTPVTNALLPYLKAVFPGARVSFRDGFALQSLNRDDVSEDFASLSDGTREQLAVLVRMGFAHILATRGAPVPLVLDDPLVYSDDERLAAMCGALNGAAHTYQIVVLTCRRSAFGNLEARDLALSPWKGS